MYIHVEWMYVILFVTEIEWVKESTWNVFISNLIDQPQDGPILFAPMPTIDLTSGH